MPATSANTPHRNRRSRKGFGAVALLLAGVGVLLAQPPQPGPKNFAFDPKVAPGPFADFAPLGDLSTADGKAAFELLRHARPFDPDTLAEKGTEPPFADLLQRGAIEPNALAKKELRFQLLKFTARLARVVRVPLTEPYLKAGFTELYDAWVFPNDRAEPLVVRVSELPRGIAPTAQFRPAPRVVVGGFFLKPIQYRIADSDPNDAAGVRYAPLLVARSFALTDDPNHDAILPLPPFDQFRELAPPPRPVAEFVPRTKYEFDGQRLLFTQIRDFTSLKDGNHFAEGTAYDELVQHARQFEARELAAAAEEVSLAELLRRKMVWVPMPGAPAEQQLKMEREDYRFRLVKVTGQLKRISRVPVSPELTAAGIADLYEGWLYPPERSDPVCLVFTDLPPGLAPTQELRPSRTVVAAGYFLKMIRYETSETGPNGKPVFRFAPLFIGRMPTDGEKPADDGGQNWRTVFLPGILTGIGLLTVLFLGLTWWFKASDKASKKMIEAKQTNPFGDPQQPAVTEPTQTSEPPASGQ